MRNKRVLEALDLISKDEQHKMQHNLWNKEHINPKMFQFVDSTIPDPGVVEFWVWLKTKHPTATTCGLEVCCGKGRNTIWLAGKNIKMAGFDFSSEAIICANNRQNKLQLPDKVKFITHDATFVWPYNDNQFDFVIDSFGSSDIEFESGRKNILNETLRVLKPGGFYFLQIDSPELGYFKEQLNTNPGPEKNTFFFPNGKIESVLTESDINNWNHPLKLLVVNKKIEYTVEIFGDTSPYKFYWIVAQSPTK